MTKENDMAGTWRIKHIDGRQLCRLFAAFIAQQPLDPCRILANALTPSLSSLNAALRVRGEEMQRFHLAALFYYAWKIQRHRYSADDLVTAWVW